MIETSYARTSTNPTPRPPGQMTAVMRAVARPEIANVLRIALVADGKMIEDRIIERGGDVTVGPDEKSTILLAPSCTPVRVRLFEATRSGYVLHVQPGMSGRLAIEVGAIDLAEQVARARGPARVTVPAGARGKIVIGDATLLFQFVPAPVPRPKAVLPVAVRQGLFSGLDWKTTFIAAFSFLFHFGVVGALYSDFSDEVVDDDMAVAQLVQELRPIPSVPIEQKVADESSKQPVAKDDKGDKDAKHGDKTPIKTSQGDTGTGNGKPHLTDTGAAMIREQLKSFDVEMTGALSKNGNATGVVIDGSNVPTAMLDQAGSNPGGVGHNKVAGLNFGSDGSTVVKPGQMAQNGPLGDLTSNGPARSGEKQVTQGPKPGIIGVTPPPASPELPDAPKVVAGMRAGLRLCYRRALDEDPRMRGTVRVTVRVGPNGEVASASPSSSGLSASMVSCVVGRVRGAQFAPPPGGGATVVIPMSFEPQE